MIKISSFSLRITILALFLAIMLGMTGVLVVFNYTQNTETALLSADGLMHEINGKILERTKSVFDPAFHLADAYSALPNLSSAPNLANHPVTLVFLRTMADNDNLSGIYAGYDDGSFYYIMRMDNQTPQTRKDMSGPDDSAFMIQLVTKNNEGRTFTLRRFLDKNLHVVGSQLVMDTTYDPRKRPWYKKAIGKEESVLSDIYLYSYSKQPGITVSRRFNGDHSGVLGVDIALAHISNFLKEQEVGNGSRMFIFREDSQIFAYPDLEKCATLAHMAGESRVVPSNIYNLDDKVASELYERFISNDKKPFNREIFSVDGRKYISSITSLPEKYGQHHYIASIIPLAEFTNKINEVGKESILVSLVILLISIPIIAVASQGISRPMAALAQEAKAITNFELDRPLELHGSIIKEVLNLNHAMLTMKSSLSTFGKFVPKSLVEKIVRMGISPKLGGERRELTILFSDIADFTSITEKTRAEELTIRISDYFERTASLIIDNGGTIDKYIGDAVMAFWNAPDKDPNHPVNACRAALMFQAECDNMAAEAIKQGLKPFHTRIGLHCGESLIGYVGTSDRMDYSAMGSVVNLASRIEGLNKYFGTRILVSDCVAKLAKDEFMFRTIGRVTAKGTSIPVTIFELVGSLTNDTGIPQCDMPWERLDRWEKGYALYLARKWKEAAEIMWELAEDEFTDPVSAYYLERIFEFIDSPPPEDWNGTENFTKK